MEIAREKDLLTYPHPAGFRITMLCCDSGSERGVRYHRSCLEVVRLSPPPPLLLPPPPGDDIFSHKHLLASSMAIMACIIGGSFCLALFCLIMRTYYTKRMNSRRSSSISFGTQEDFLEEDQGPHMDHPIWYINTIGLQQFVIDSITVFKYRKDDGLIEGTECSVCLSEFQEEESLRLLPKCSHGFHLPCIDTWLRSHKNCPLCRAPVVSDAIVAQATPPELNSDNLSSPDAIREDNLENQIWEGNRDVEEGETSEERIGNDSFGSEDEKTLPESRKTNCDSLSRVLSDLASTHRVVEDDIQPMRRSVSLDSSSASMIYNAVAGVIPGKHQQSFDSQSVKLKNPKAKRTSPSLCKLVKSSSIRYSLQKVPVSMKRSFSSSGKIFSSRRTRSQDSILPL